MSVKGDKVSRNLPVQQVRDNPRPGPTPNAGILGGSLLERR